MDRPITLGGDVEREEQLENVFTASRANETIFPFSNTTACQTAVARLIYKNQEDFCQEYPTV